jgi:hypothetical protein
MFINWPKDACATKPESNDRVATTVDVSASTNVTRHLSRRRVERPSTRIRNVHDCSNPIPTARSELMVPLHLRILRSDFSKWALRLCRLAVSSWLRKGHARAGSPRRYGEGGARSLRANTWRQRRAPSRQAAEANTDQGGALAPGRP